MKPLFSPFLKMAILLLLVTGPYSFIYAQGVDYQKVKAESDSMAQKLTEKLELDETQHEALKTILFEADVKEKALKEHIIRMEKTLNEQVQLAIEEKNTKIEALLTDKQLKMLKKEQKKAAQ